MGEFAHAVSACACGEAVRVDALRLRRNAPSIRSLACVATEPFSSFSPLRSEQPHLFARAGSSEEKRPRLSGDADSARASSMGYCTFSFASFSSALAFSCSMTTRAFSMNLCQNFLRTHEGYWKAPDLQCRIQLWAHCLSQRARSSFNAWEVSCFFSKRCMLISRFSTML